jgi:hypothetical protein
MGKSKRGIQHAITDVCMPSFVLSISLRKLNGFFDFSGLEALYANADSFRRSVDDRPDGLKVRQKTTRCYTGDLLANAAFFLCQTSPDYRPAGNGLFTADRTYF